MSFGGLIDTFRKQGEQKKTHSQKKKVDHENYIIKRFNLRFQTEARKVILDKIAHYTVTGNLRKLDIYQRKLEANNGFIDSIKAVFKI